VRLYLAGQAADPRAPAQDFLLPAHWPLGKSGLLVAGLGRDSRMLSLVKLALFSKKKTAAERWSPSAHTHFNGECSVVLSRFTQSMYSVDDLSHRPSKHLCTQGACTGCAGPSPRWTARVGGVAALNGTACRTQRASSVGSTAAKRANFSDATRWDHVGRGAPQQP
jgi:hypothetical protein